LIETSVTFGNRSIPYFLGAGLTSTELTPLFEDLEASGFHLIFDARVPGAFVRLLTRVLSAVGPTTSSAVDACESGKTLQTLEYLANRTVERGLDRKSVIVGVGGGLVGNLAGFLAGTLFRGIGLVQVPTTLLAASDSVVSQKQAVNVRARKNVIGTYYQPQLILFDAAAVRDAPYDVHRQGLAESAKNCFIHSPSRVDSLLSDSCALRSGRSVEAALRVVRDALEIKGPFLRVDELEKGPALIFEYGHTVGHALELQSPSRIGHGDAIAVGGLVAAMVATHRFGRPEIFRAQLEVVKALGIPTDLVFPPREDLMASVLTDGKRGLLAVGDDTTAMVLLEDLGKPFHTGDIPLSGVTLEDLSLSFEELASCLN
jgi:3-dehydroquinate synthase/2-deoxy-scyllo-inosose synthase